MNTAALEAYLASFWWQQLRDLAQTLGLPTRGSRRAIVERVLEMHAYSASSRQVVLAVEHAEHVQRQSGRKRRRGEEKTDTAVRDLSQQFDAVAAVAGTPTPALTATLAVAASPVVTAVMSETVDAADVSDCGGEVVRESPATACSRRRPLAELTPGELSPGHLIYIPAHMCPWQETE